MNKPSVKHLIIICSVILLLLITIFAIQLTNEKKLSKFYSKIVKIDNNIKSAYFLKAYQGLNEITDDIFNSKTALIFLKRASRIADLTGDYEIFLDYARKINNIYKRNKEISAVYAWALQKTGDFSESLKLTTAKLAKTDYYSFHLINLLSIGIDTTNLSLNRKYTGNFEFLFTDEEISDETLITAAAAIRDERFILDAALINTQNADLDTAYQIIQASHSRSFPEVKAVLSYDIGDYLSALKYFELIESPGLDLTLTGCDILLRNGLNSRAAAVYSEMIDLNPEVGSLPYRNLYAINNNYDLRYEWLKNGLQYFPSDNELLMSYAWEKYLLKDFKNIAEIINRVEIDSTSVELFKLTLMLSGRSPEHIIGNFWNIFNSNMNSEVVAVSFSNYLLKNKQFEQLDLLLDRYIQNNEIASWIYNYYAVSNAMLGKYSTASAYIDKAVETENNISNSYNKAVILKLQQKYDEAAKLLENAIIIDDYSTDSDYREKIFYCLAETNYLNGDYKDAEFYLKKLEMLNSDDIKGSLLKKKIQEQYND